ncbi:glycosyltransferase family 4 protein [Joostella sp. CR20]|uniref:glycosyltransferase family 4 protein n=1 Tax=Joostella sp. CR20 TaxID=2804312 RepID=UPI00313C6FA2
MKKVLIICYYWPPAGGPGVQRWLNFVKYLPEFGVEPIVYVPENPDYPMEDTSFLAEVPTSVRVIKQPIFEPYKLASLFSGKKTKQISKGIISKKKQSLSEKFLLWVRGNFFIPDARIFWVKPSVTFLEEFLQQEKIGTIITTGPPHSVHLIGMKLKALLNVNWIADFRDPWTTIGYHSELKLSEKSKAKHEKLEQAVLTSADQIIVTSFTTKTEFKALTNRPIEVITNGFLDTDDKNIKLNKNFTLSHIGSLLSGRNPNILWEVLGSLIEENENFKKDFQLQLAGAVSEDVLETINENGLQSNLSLLGYVSHDEALQLQRSASVLLLIEIDAEKTRGIIPGKLFEYLASERPIVAIGPEKWDVFTILNETKAGSCFLYTDREKLKSEILSLYNAFKNDKLYVNSEGIAKYHRKSLTEHLATLIK